MKNSRRNKFLLIWFILITFQSCSTPSSSFYKVSNKSEGSFARVELLVTPDRIILQCENVQDPDEKPDKFGRFGFMIHILDDEDTVLTVSQGSVLPKRDCFDRIEKIESILKNGKEIYIGAIGNIEKLRKKDEESPKQFPNRNKLFYWNSRALQFHVIKNEKNECYSAYYKTEKPCPKDGFPIKNNPI